MPDTELTAGQKRVTWRHLEDLGAAYRASRSRTDLEKLIAAWNEYSNAFDNEHDTLEMLGLVWRELKKQIEFRAENDSSLSFRFPAPAKAIELQIWLQKNLFKTYTTGVFIFVRNTELCFLGMDDYVKQVNEAERLPDGFIDMVLVNRLMLAMEMFALKMEVSGAWKVDNGYPNAYEMIIGRVRDFYDEYF